MRVNRFLHTAGYALFDQFFDGCCAKRRLLDWVFVVATLASLFLRLASVTALVVDSGVIIPFEVTLGIIEIMTATAAQPLGHKRASLTLRFVLR